MLRKLLPLYENSILFRVQPEHPPEGYYIFFDELQNEWIGIPNNKINDKEILLLKALYSQLEYPSHIPPNAKIWHEFLLKNGHPPSCSLDMSFRFIQFSIKGDGVDPLEIESALKGFFTEEVIIFWENPNRGILIEEKKLVTLSEKEMIDLSETLETDFYVKISFYIGKLHPFSEELPMQFQQEKDYFIFGQNHINNTAIYTFERVFPIYTAYHLPGGLKEKITEQINTVFKEDIEIFTTIKAFLENNLNASVTAKKLYIHRNTLQYRIDKFVERTGIGLKDFYGAFTIFLACILFELETRT